MLACLAGISLLADEDAAGTESPELKRDYSEMEGVWQRQTRDKKGRELTVTKTKRQGVSAVTVKDSEGNVLRSHRSEYELQRTGQVRIFKYWNRTVTEGPDAGQFDPKPRRYVYRIAGDRFYEIHGILTDEAKPPVIVIWKRVKAKNEVTSL